MSHAESKNNSEDVVVIEDSQEASSNSCVPTTASATKSKKRQAEDATEDGPKKAAKLSKGDDATSSKPVEVEEVEHRVVYGPNTLEQAYEKRGRFIASLQTKLKGFRINNQALKDQVDEYEEAAASAMTKEKDAGRANFNVKTKEDYDAKLAKWKKTYEAKVKNNEKQKTEKIEDLKEKQQDALQTKDVKHRKEMEELRDKCDAKEEEWRVAKTKYSEEVKTMKAEQREYLKKVKTEKEEEIKEWKPEHSKTVKEKETMIKEKQKEIDGLLAEQRKSKLGIERAGGVLRGMQVEREAMRKSYAEKDVEYQTLQDRLASREKDVEMLQREQMGAEKMHLHEMEEQGKRWKLKSDEAQGLAGMMAQMKRAMFAMRHGLDRGAAEIEKLKAELQVAKEQTAAFEKGLRVELMRSGKMAGRESSS